jgi:hypothetical protein
MLPCLPPRHRTDGWATCHSGCNTSSSTCRVSDRDCSLRVARDIAREGPPASDNSRAVCLSSTAAEATQVYLDTLNTALHDFSDPGKLPQDEPPEHPNAPTAGTRSKGDSGAIRTGTEVGAGTAHASVGGTHAGMVMHAHRAAKAALRDYLEGHGGRQEHHHWVFAQEPGSEGGGRGGGGTSNDEDLWRGQSGNDITNAQPLY